MYKQGLAKYGRQIKRLSSTSRPSSNILLEPKKPKTIQERAPTKVESKQKDAVKMTVANVMDYSWLPKAPTLKAFSSRELRLQSLYSGYRPVFMEYKQEVPKATGEASDEATLWSYSCAETEYFQEWENVPVDVANELKPFEVKKVMTKEEVHKEKIRADKGQFTGGRKRGMPSKYMKTMKYKNDRKTELKRLLSKAKKEE